MCIRGVHSSCGLGVLTREQGKPLGRSAGWGSGSSGCVGLRSRLRTDSNNKLGRSEVVPKRLTGIRTRIHLTTQSHGNENVEGAAKTPGATDLEDKAKLALANYHSANSARRDDSRGSNHLAHPRLPCTREVRTATDPHFLPLAVERTKSPNINTNDAEAASLSSEKTLLRPADDVRSVRGQRIEPCSSNDVAAACANDGVPPARRKGDLSTRELHLTMEM